MDSLFDSAKSITKMRDTVDDTLADRLSSKFTAGILMFFAAFAMTRATFGSPLTCWMPVHFTGSHTKYTNSYCWIFNTYYVPWEQVDMPERQAERQYIIYYQWMPFIFAIQAIFFYLPSAFWHAFNSKGGVDLDDCVQTAADFSKNGFDQSSCDSLVALIDRFLSNKQNGESGGPKCCNRRMGGYMIVLFLFSKMLYIANAVAQLFVLKYFLGFDFHSYGVDVMTNMIDDHQWADRPHVPFPRVSMCDFDIRRLGQVQTYTVQCVMPFNIVNEKSYIFLWFWFIFVIVVSSVEFLVWVVRFIFFKDRYIFIRNHVGGKGSNGQTATAIASDSNMMEGEVMVHDTAPRDQQNVEKFTKQYVRQDGVLLLRLIAHNTDHVTTVEIVSNLYETWYKQYVGHKSQQQIQQWQNDTANNKLTSRKESV